MVSWDSFTPHPVFGLDEVGRGCLAGPVLSAAATLKSSYTFPITSSCILSLEGLESDPFFTFYEETFNSFKKNMLLNPMSLGSVDLDSMSLNSKALGSKNLDSKNFSTKKKPLLTDSKMLTKKQRESLIPSLLDQYMICLSLSTPEEIDTFNILQASLLSMKRATLGLEALLGQKAGHLLIDGTFKIPSLDREQTTLIQGDLRCSLISAASVVAKVFRDYLMTEFALIFPHYNLTSHKGYPSLTHRKALQEWGPSPIHRKSFKTKAL
jgi:ribonuclease HII